MDIVQHIKTNLDIAFEGYSKDDFSITVRSFTNSEQSITFNCIIIIDNMNEEFEPLGDQYHTHYEIDCDFEVLKTELYSNIKPNAQVKLPLRLFESFNTILNKVSLALKLSIKKTTQNIDIDQLKEDVLADMRSDWQLYCETLNPYIVIRSIDSQIDYAKE